MKRADRLRNRYRGVMLGMACGDALGAQIEFSKRDSYPEQRDFTGAGPHKLKAGQWTDDTAMALILAEHLSSDPGVLRESEIASKWVRWWQHGYMSCTGECFDIGTQTHAALEHWLRTFERPTHNPTRRGNGALMRVAPVALAHPRDTQQLLLAAHRQTIVTHPHTCAEIAGTFAKLVRDCVYASTPKAALDTINSEMFIPVARRRNRVKSTGYDKDTFEAAIWAVRGAKSAEDAIIRAVNLGDDADTVGAVAGALAGAVWGADSLPERWVSQVAWAERLTDAADRLFDMQGE